MIFDRDLVIMQVDKYMTTTYYTDVDYRIEFCTESEAEVHNKDEIQTRVKIGEYQAKISFYSSCYTGESSFLVRIGVKKDILNNTKRKKNYTLKQLLKIWHKLKDDESVDKEELLAWCIKENGDFLIIHKDFLTI